MAIIRSVINVLRMRRNPFSYNYHNRISNQTRGIYIFWLHGCCLYVGISGDIGRRMYQHRMAEDNAKLERYFKAFSRDIEVSYFVLQDKSNAELRRFERKAIWLLRSITNMMIATGKFQA